MNKKIWGFIFCCFFVFTFFCFASIKKPQISKNISNTILVTENTNSESQGKNIIYSTSGDDVIHGKRGGDTLRGGAGNDTYVYEYGDNVKYIFDNIGEENIILLGRHFTHEHLDFYRINHSLNKIDPNGDNLEINLYNIGMTSFIGRIIVFDFFKGNSINAIWFKNGQRPLSNKEIKRMAISILGTDGNDSIEPPK